MAGKEKAKAKSPREGYALCPECGIEVKEKNLESHLERVHGISPVATEAKRDWRPVAAAVVVALLVLSFGVYAVLSPLGSDSGGGPTPLYPGDNVVRTTDGWDIVCTYTPGNDTETAVVFIHGMNENRQVWNSLASKVRSDTGYSTLTFDLRGHGESTSHNGNTETLSSFSESDFTSMIRDVNAVVKALEDTGYRNFILVGASIGANLALVYGASHGNVMGVALLSPGSQYHGISATEAAADYGARPAYIGVSYGDTYANSSVPSLSNYMPGAEVHYFSGSDHGTNLLKDGADRQIIAWIKGL